MTTARKALICLNATPYHHVVARCVRRAWLWGVDQYAGRDYSHRKRWVIERLRQLSEVFSVEVCAYAVMSNHYHLVLHVDTSEAARWSNQQVIERWTKLFSKPLLIERFEKGLCGVAERAVAVRLLDGWRRRLVDVSWYMRCLNEHLARRANQEDQCTGRFWEGRFKSQALLDEAGLLTAMAYVDLNPIRAGIAQTPEESKFTSIYQRIRAARVDARRACYKSLPRSESGTVPLKMFQDGHSGSRDAIPFLFEEYVLLLDWTGRARAPGKRGSIEENLPRMAQRLNIDARAWLGMMKSGGNVFGRALGHLGHLRLHAKALGQAWIRGLRQAERIYKSI